MDGRSLPGKGTGTCPDGLGAPPAWITDECSQVAMRAIKTIVFEYNPVTQRQFVSPFIGEYVVGNYDGRLLSNVMLEDGVIHPEDLELSVRFREQVKSGGAGTMTLRLMTPSGTYHWFKMQICVCGRSNSLVGTLADVDEEVLQRKLLQYRAQFDSVSRIYNKAAFFEETRKLLEAEPERQRMLIRFDVDRFKIVNELYGVSEGDSVLLHIGQIVGRLAKAGETFARMGDDVFCACLERDEAGVLRFVEQLEGAINEYPLAFQFVISVGIVRIPYYQGLPVNILCDRAALAQRTVKGSYVKRYAFYEDWMGAALSREHQITGYMRQALEGGEFKVYFQPKYDMRTHRIVGAEALARWMHPGEGMIMPGDFIPLFERNGFILRLDEYIWEQVCLILRGWMDRGMEPVPVSVNVSRIHLHDPMFCEKIMELSRKYRLPPPLMEMEITESAYIESPETLYDIMEKMQRTGYHFLMDDFGSGYSSLNVLKDIPVDQIKMDFNFLKAARRGGHVGRDVLQGAIRLVHDIGLPIIVEGVETKEQAEFLLGVGCQYGQGYYFAKPMPLEEFEKLLTPPR